VKVVNVSCNCSLQVWVVFLIVCVSVGIVDCKCVLFSRCVGCKLQVVCVDHMKEIYEAIYEAIYEGIYERIYQYWSMNRMYEKDEVVITFMKECRTELLCPLLDLPTAESTNRTNKSPISETQLPLAKINPIEPPVIDPFNN
jgi:hypothetical protein